MVVHVLLLNCYNTKMKIIELQLFLISLILLIISFNNIYFNLADIYFNNGNKFELFTSLMLSIFVFIIGHLIVIFNQYIKFNKRIYLLKCIYVIFLLYVCVFLASDATEILVSMFLNGVHVSELHLDNRQLDFSFFLGFIVLVLLLILKNFNFNSTQYNNLDNDYE